ncbi:MAG: hypothetical protein OEY10_07780 [Nitrosopumilus sp.]|nr:hypothetical protein [Candidatus Bathyarchaeota archaeon]MDH5666179.1 hypothetical protein [Nitrosopumilus sp.]
MTRRIYPPIKYCPQCGGKLEVEVHNAKIYTNSTLVSYCEKCDRTYEKVNVTKDNYQIIATAGAIVKEKKE